MLEPGPPATLLRYCIYLSKIIKVDEDLKFDEVLTETILHSFFWGTVYICALYAFFKDYESIL